MKKGWLVNDTLTCIPGTKTFWHDLLEWLPTLEDKCNGNTPFNTLPTRIENDYINEPPDYIIRNATYFRRMDLPLVKTVSLLQDIAPTAMQLDVCNNSDVVVYNSPYTQSHYTDKIHSKSVMIPLGVDFNKFKPLNEDFSEELGILPNSILFIGANNNAPKGFDVILDIINNSNFNFCLVMKDDYSNDNPRVKVFNRVNHDKLVKIMNSCQMLVCTSRVETLHLAGVEAGACGLPIVTSNVGIYYDMPSGDWGVNVGSYNYNDFIDKISYVKSNIKEFNIRESFLKKGLDTETCKNKWIDLIKNL